MAEILIEKLKRNGWPEDQPREMVDESSLEYSEGVENHDGHQVAWREWRLDGKIVKRGAHITLQVVPT